MLLTDDMKLKMRNITTTIHTSSRSYDNFNRLLGVNGYSYTYNDKDERTKQTLADGNYWNYEYDTFGQVTSGIKKTSAGAQVSGQNYAYTYDTIGNVIATTGTVASPWKFSSEYHDSETDWVYYNYRDYAPSLGRWISRDPIGEAGGINLYIMLGNQIVNSSDFIGLFSDGLGSEGIAAKKARLAEMQRLIDYLTEAKKRFGGLLNTNFDAIIENYKYLMQNIKDNLKNRLGHKDFTGGDIFDYTAEDHDPATEPFGHPQNHFQDPIDAMNDVLNAIAVCDKFLFERAMHRLQDNWTHYAKGFRSTWFHGWHPKHWGCGHICVLESPDYDYEAWKKAENATKRMVKYWKKNCCQDENKNWHPKASGCCEK